MADQIIAFSEPDQSEIWKLTWEKVEKFCPSIKNDLWPSNATPTVREIAA